jgi:hypothetical protein
MHARRTPLDDVVACRWLLLVLGSSALRFAFPLLVAVTAVTAVSCVGSDDRTAVPVPIAQRFLTAEDAPGSNPDPVETRQTTEDFDEFIAVLTDASIDPDKEEMTAVFQDAGFKVAGVDARFFGESHNPETSPHVFSSFIEVESADGATRALEWLETDLKKPCPRSCATRISDFDVADIAGARGVHRIARAEDIEAVGATEQRPRDSYWVGFTDGALVYTLDLQGPPGSVSEKQAHEIASAYYERLTGS